jgi:hypothetical protein
LVLNWGSLKIWFGDSRSGGIFIRILLEMEFVHDSNLNISNLIVHSNLQTKF